MFKRLVASVMVSCLVLSMSMTVFATEVTTDEETDAVAVTSVATSSDEEEGIKINEANFPDAALREAVLEAEEELYEWGVLSGVSDGILNESELATIDFLFIIGASDLTGIELLTSLIEVYLEDVDCVEFELASDTLTAININGTDNLEKIVLSDCTALTNVYVSGEGLTSIDLGDDNIVECFMMSNSAVTSMDFSGNTNLQVVSCNYSESLAELNLSGCTELTYVSIDGTKVAAVDLSDATKLRSFTANDSKLSKIDVSNCPELTELSVTNTNVTSIDVTKNIELWSLDCSNTKVSSLDLSNNTELYRLFALNTNITSLDLSNVTDLSGIQVAGTYLEDVTLNPDSTGTISKIDAGLVSYNKVTDEYTLVTSLLQADDELVLPDNVTSIAYNAFAGANTPSLIEVPTTVTSMAVSGWGGVFVNCSNLITVVFGEDTVVYGDIFDNCKNLAEIYFRGVAPMWYQAFDMEDYEYAGDLADMTLTVYYPEGADEWADYLDADFGGTITWVEWDATSEVSLPESDTDSDTTSSTTAMEIVATATVEDGVASATVSSVFMTEMISNAILSGAMDDGVVVNVAVETDGVVTTVALTVPMASIGELAGNNVVSFGVVSELVGMSFDEAAILAIQAQTGSDVTFSMTVVDSSGLSEEAQALVGDRPVFSFSVTDADGVKVTDFDGGVVTISIPYELQDDEEAEGIIVYYIDEDGELEAMEVVEYDEENGCVVFQTTHFSTYAIAYEAVATDDEDATTGDDTTTEEDATSPETGDSANVALFLVIFAVAAMGMGVAVFQRKRAK